MRRVLVLARACALAGAGGRLGARDAEGRRRPASSRSSQALAEGGHGSTSTSSCSFPSVEVYDLRAGSLRGDGVLDGLNVVAPVPKLPPARTRCAGTCSRPTAHVVSGVWTFGVRVKAPPPTEAFGAGGPTATEHVVRWLYFLSFARADRLARVPADRACAAPPLPPRVDKRLYVAVGRGVVGAIEVGILAFCLRCEDVLQLPFGKYVYGDLTPISDGTRFGKAFVMMTLGFALVAALVYLAWLLERRGAARAGARPVARARRRGSRSRGTTRSTPARRRRPSSPTGCTSRRRRSGSAGCWRWRSPSGRSHRELAARGVLPLLAGRGRARRRSCSPRGRTSRSSGCRISRDLWTQRYGDVLLVKVSLVAAGGRVGGRPPLLRAAAARERGRRRTLARVGRSLAGESLVGVAVLLAAAVLVDSKPPPRPVPAAVTQAAAQHR